MEFTVAQAISALNDPKYVTLDGLKNLASQVSVKMPGSDPGAVTLLYSGGLQPNGSGSTLPTGAQAWQLAKPISDSSGGKVMVIDNTPVAEFLKSNEFAVALEKAYGLGFNESIKNNLLFGTQQNGVRVEGFFDAASRRLVQAAPGDIKTLSPFAGETSTYNQIELREVLLGADSNIKQIDGVPIEQYRTLYNDTLQRTGNAVTALDDVRNAVSAKSWVNSLEREFRTNSAGVVEVGTGRFFADPASVAASCPRASRTEQQSAYS